MDSLTHIVLGAATGQLVLGKKVGNKALVWGAIAGSLPDFDAFISPLLHPVDALLFHRGPSHAILFAAVAAPIVGIIASKIHRDNLFKHWSLLAFVAILMHSTIDIFNTYGTALLLPFSDVRLAFDSMSIIDILLLFPIVGIMVAMLFKPQASAIRRKLAWFILIYTALFVGLSVANKLHIQRKVITQLKEQEISYTRLKTAPLPITNFLWLAIAEDSAGYHFGYVSNFDKHSIDFKYINRNESLLADFNQNEKIKNLIRFTDGFYIVEQKDDNSLWVHDLRFGSMGFSDEDWFVFSFEISGTSSKVHVSRAKTNRKFSVRTLKQYMQRLTKDL
ncbi:MAG: metal-dependent hydrolase [Tenuifilaceae bacterium]|nr:metal-dependent hydrolase [Tenuifilaceae bacterium]